MEQRAYWQDQGNQFGLLLWVGAIINPDEDPRLLRKVNVDMPLTGIRSFLDARPENRAATFGSALEGIALQNAYIASKKALFDELEAMVNPSIMHIRTHTLVGQELPHPHMFLGQLVRAIHSQSDFLMHGTNQVRQFIHYRDFAQVAMEVIDSEVTDRRLLTTVGATACTNLFELATQMMQRFNPRGRVNLDTSKAWTTDQTLTNQAENDLVTGSKDPTVQIQELFEGWLETLG